MRAGDDLTLTPREAALASAETIAESLISSFSTRSEDFAPLIRPTIVVCELVGLHTRSSPVGGWRPALVKSSP